MFESDPNRPLRFRLHIASDAHLLYGSRKDGGEMAQTRFKVTVTRENQPSHQMAEMSMTMDGDMLLEMIRGMVDMRDKKDLMAEQYGVGGQFAFGTLKSVTIVRVDGPDA
jgi:hypothetical protein